jgi:aminoglycoside 6'-N-acetyltransferase I
VGFVACPAGEPTCAVAFAEVSLRPYVNGCKSSPVAFLEGLYVDPAWRLQGVARELVRAAEAWGRRAGCAEFASDIHLENHISHATHLALGFAETERVIYFRKALQ